LPSAEGVSVEAIDEQLIHWRQRDVVLSTALPFVHLADYTKPLTDQSRDAAENDRDGSEPLGVVFTDVPGFVVLSQTCDVVRSCRDRPFVELAVVEPLAPAI